MAGATIELSAPRSDTSQNNTASLEQLAFIGAGAVRSVSQMKDFFETFNKLGYGDQVVPADAITGDSEWVDSRKSYYILGTRDQIKRTLRLNFTVKTSNATLFLRAVHTTALKQYVKKSVQLMLNPPEESALADVGKVLDHFKSMMTGCNIVQVGELMPGMGDHSDKHYLPTMNSTMQFHLIWSLLVKGNLIR